MLGLKKRPQGVDAKSKASGNAAVTRVQKDITDLSLPNTCRIEYPNPNELLNFYLTVCPDEGYYKGGSFRFNFVIGGNYPFDPPKVKCETPVFHPNIDYEGNICLNILREDWNPVLSISSIVYGLLNLFHDPKPDDPLNREAGELLRTNPRHFEQVVYKSMRGGYIGDKYFEPCIRR